MYVLEKTDVLTTHVGHVDLQNIVKIGKNVFGMQMLLKGV